MKDQIMINSLTQTKITDYFSKNPKLSTDISNDDNNSTFSFFPTNENERGQADPVYMSTIKQVKYKAKWIVGTTYMYDYGLAENPNSRYDCVFTARERL